MTKHSFFESLFDMLVLHLEMIHSVVLQSGLVFNLIAPRRTSTFGMLLEGLSSLSSFFLYLCILESLWPNNIEDIELVAIQRFMAEILDVVLRVDFIVAVDVLDFVLFLELLSHRLLVLQLQGLISPVGCNCQRNFQ